VLKLSGPPASWGPPSKVSLEGLALYAPEDPEPEFVDINDRNEAVVTLQENNHIVSVHLPTLAVTQHFSAGGENLNGVDLTDNDTISLTESQPDRRAAARLGLRHCRVRDLDDDGGGLNAVPLKAAWHGHDHAVVRRVSMPSPTPGVHDAAEVELPGEPRVARQ
jgi:hypothetical protein